jgi:kynurenine formamidase
MPRLLDLSHRITPGMFTHPGLPGPEWDVFRTRQDFEQAGGTTFQIDRVTMVGNTGTYLDSPFHRFADGSDLAGIALERVADLPVLLVDARAQRGVGVDLLATAFGDDEIAGAAVLLNTGGDEHWGSEQYAVAAPYVTADAAEWLARRKPALVGIDAVNIDDLADLSRPAHTQLLGNDVLVLEHLTNRGAGPDRGARLHAAPLAWHAVGTWPVRAYAVVPG